MFAPAEEHGHGEIEELEEEMEDEDELEDGEEEDDCDDETSRSKL